GKRRPLRRERLYKLSTALPYLHLIFRETMFLVVWLRGIMKGFAAVLLGVEEETCEMTLTHEACRQFGICQHGTKPLIMPINITWGDIEPQKILSEPFELDVLQRVNSLGVVGRLQCPRAPHIPAKMASGVSRAGIAFKIQDQAIERELFHLLDMCPDIGRRWRAPS